jgi:hypothetical protein
MNNLTREQELYYLTNRKSNLIAFLLSLFLLPVALIYTRGILGWLASLIFLFISTLVLCLLLIITTNDISYTETIIHFVCLCTYLLYMLFAITDARRVNINLIKQLLGEQYAL